MLGCVTIEIVLDVQIMLFLIMTDALVELNAANYEKWSEFLLDFFRS